MVFVTFLWLAKNDVTFMTISTLLTHLTLLRTPEAGTKMSVGILDHPGQWYKSPPMHDGLKPAILEFHFAPLRMPTPVVKSLTERNLGPT